MSKQLRPEIAIDYNRGDLLPHLEYYTWKNPQRCQECGDIIHTHQYFYYEKPRVQAKDKPFVEYYCCLSCFDRLAPSDAFKYPMSKIIQKELPESERTQFWRNPQTGQIFTEAQYMKVPLNPDAFNQGEESDKEWLNPEQLKSVKADQDELLRISQASSDDRVRVLVRDLDSLQEDPLSGQ